MKNQEDKLREEVELLFKKAFLKKFASIYLGIRLAAYKKQG